MKYLIIMTFLFTSTLFADTTANGKISIIKEGEKASYDGFLVDKPQMKHFRQINEEKKLSELKNIKLEELGKIRENSVEWYKDSYNTLRKDYDAEQRRSFWRNTFYFMGGVLITGAISYGTMKYLKD